MTMLLGHLADRWITLDGADEPSLASYPKLADSALVVSDFGSELVSGVVSLEGNPIHAPTLVSRRLRSEGAVDGECHVVIHALERADSGYMACYSAVPMERWKKLQAWSQSQARVCLVVPLMSLLAKQLSSGRGVVALCGRNLVFIARLNQRIVHGATLAFSDEPGDLDTAVLALGARIQQELADEGAGEQVLEVVWHTVLRRTGDGLSDAELSSTLASIFFSQAQLFGTVAPLATVRDGEGWVETSVPTLLKADSFAASINSLRQRVSWLLERHAFAWSVGFGACALAGITYAGAVFIQAQSVAQVTRQLYAQEQKLQVRVRELEAQAALPANYEAWSQLLRDQVAVTQRFDVNRIVATVAAAAQASGVRVLRIYTMSLSRKERTPASKRMEASDKVLVVDGAFAPDAQGGHVEQLARFVADLHSAGFEASPIDTNAGRLDGNLLAQVFTYRLTPMSRGEAS